MNNAILNNARDIEYKKAFLDSMVYSTNTINTTIPGQIGFDPRKTKAEMANFLGVDKSRLRKLLNQKSSFKTIEMTNKLVSKETNSNQFENIAVSA